MLRIGALWLVSTVIGAIAGAAALVALTPEPPRPEIPPPSERDLERNDQSRLVYRPNSILCFFSKATQKGDPVGFFPADPCDPDPPILHELQTLLNLGEDGILRVADAEALQASFRHSGTIDSWQSEPKIVTTEVTVLRDVNVTSAMTTSLNRICGRWHQPRVTALQCIAALEEVIVEHWNEIESCFPVHRLPARSLEENLSAIIDRRSCDIPEYFRDATLAAIAIARSKGRQSSGQLRNDAVAAIVETRTKLLTSLLDAQHDDLCKMLHEYDKLAATTPDEPERIRQILLQYVAMDAKYPNPYQTQISKYQIWTALRDWPELATAAQ